ncbi:MAG: hypothetical protein U0457_17210 [Candidatus Sericytochromatia bacterium]
MKSINNWIKNISEKSKEEIESIENLLSYDFNVNKSEPLVKEVFFKFSEKIKGLKIEEEIWEIIFSFYKFEIPDELALDLINRNIAVSALGHTRQSDKIMFKLFDLVEESLLTIGKEFYREKSRSTEEFKNVLLKNL